MRGRNDAGRKAKDAGEAQAQPQAEKPIDLYYWPTPNGWKVSIMLEECGLPYNVIPVNIAQRRAVQAGIPENLAEQPDARDRRSRRAGRAADLGVRVRRDPAISRPQDRQVLSGGRARARCGRRMAVLADGQSRSQGRRGQPFPPLCAGDNCPMRIDRFGNEMNRLYGVMNTRLKERRFLAGAYSIADMACVGWIRLLERQGERRSRSFPHLKRWLDAVRARPAVQRGMHIRVEEASRVDVSRSEGARRAVRPAGAVKELRVSERLPLLGYRTANGRRLGRDLATIQESRNRRGICVVNGAVHAPPSAVETHSPGIHRDI